MNDIQERLFILQDVQYKAFMEKLVPNIPENTVIGVRLPDLRKFAGELVKEGKAEGFLKEVPHKYFEENHLHSFIVDKISKNFEEAILRTEKFLPYIDNWAICDSFRPKALKENMPKLYQNVKKWMQSGEPYTIRFALVLQLNWFLEEYFKPEMLKSILQIQSEDYYVNMAISWYYSIALVKQYQEVIPLFTSKVLPVWIHNKALQKAIESRQISVEMKKYLRSLKRNRKEIDSIHGAFSAVDTEKKR